MRPLSSSAAERGPGGPLAAAPHEYHFFQLVLLLEHRLRERHPGLVPLGQGTAPLREGLRLRPHLGLGFPAADVHSASVDEEQGRAEVVTTFFGLGGVNSPLPRWYTQQLLWDEEDVPQQRAFLDIFHHRILSLLYRTWRQHRYEQAFEPGAGDRLSRALLDLLGVSPQDTEHKLGLSPQRLLRYLGLFLLRHRPAEGLRHLLEEELGLQGLLRIEPFPVRWVHLDWSQLFRLRRGPAPGGQLGQDLFLGRKRLDRMGLLELHVGPLAAARAGGGLLRYEQAQRLAPGGADHLRLLRLIRLYLLQPLDVRLILHVPLPGVPLLRLQAGGARLGPTALCRTGGFRGDRLADAALGQDVRVKIVDFRFEVPLPSEDDDSHVPG